MYQNAALFFKKHNSVFKNTIRFSKTQFNFRNTIQFQKHNSISRQQHSFHFTFTDNKIQFSKTLFDFQKHNSVSKTQYNFTTTMFIPYPLKTQFNFQKHKFT